MNELERQMVRKAARKHDKIYPCADKQQLSDCFTRHENQVFFWYNTEDQSTHVIAATEHEEVKK